MSGGTRSRSARLCSTPSPNPSEPHVAPEAVYRTLYVQGRSQLRRVIRECPAEAEDRVVPGRWEGDLIIGKDSRCAIGSLASLAY